MECNAHMESDAEERPLLCMPPPLFNASSSIQFSDMGGQVQSLLSSFPQFAIIGCPLTLNLWDRIDVVSFVVVLLHIVEKITHVNHAAPNSLGLDRKRF
jgi:hypothetical protein